MVVGHIEGIPTKSSNAIRSRNVLVNVSMNMLQLRRITTRLEELNGLIGARDILVCVLSGHGVD